jgi:hypothetical protein
MSREMYGISALDPRVAATDKFIQDKQIPPDKVEDFLLSMGADPKLASLVFKYRRVQEAAKQQQAQPPTASVDQEVSSQYAQLKQRERMGQGVAGMPAPNLARAPMQGGITGQPMPQMAGGGIVAFAKGGRSPRTYTVDPEGNVDIGSAGDLIPYETEAPPPKSSSKAGVLRRIVGNPIVRRAGGLGILATALGAFLGDDEPKAEGATVEEAPSGTEFTPEEIAILARDQAAQKEDTQVATPTKINLPAAPTFKRPDLTPFTEAIAEAKKRVPKDREAALAEEMAREEQLGETKVIEARGKELKAQREKAVTSPEKKFWLAFAQAGFAASAKGARNLWETLSIGGVEGMKAYEAMKDKEQQLRERLQEKRFQLEDLRAQIKRGATSAGRARFDALSKEVDAAESALVTTQVAVNTAKNTRAGQIYEVESANARNQANINSREAMQRDLTAAKANAGNLDYQIARAVAKANDFRLPAQERATYQKLVDRLVRQRAEIEATESGVISKKLGLDADAAMMGGMSDGFDSLERQ